MRKAKKGRVLFAGQMYYHTWYLSRELRKLGWKADVLSWDPNPAHDMYYHGEDFKFTYDPRHVKKDCAKQLAFYIKALTQYDIFHFSNAYGINFGSQVSHIFSKLESWTNYIIRKQESRINHILRKLRLQELSLPKLELPLQPEIQLLRKLGKKIVYSNNGCLDGMSQSSHRSWPEPIQCDICRWQNVPAICSDERNLAWGKLRNSLADYQCTLVGTHKDYNDDPRVHEVPEFYCLDPEFWHPNLEIPDKYRLTYPLGTVKIYHAVGGYDQRTDSSTQRNIKCSHIYLPLIKQLKVEGYPVELIFAKDIPNKEVRFLQVQADIVVDKLIGGFFGSNVKEALMLGKTAVCYLRPEWLANIRLEVPEYIDELPVVSATPDTIHDVLVDLIQNPEKRQEIGRRSREFAIKWHSAEAGAKRLDKIYLELLGRG